MKRTVTTSEAMFEIEEYSLGTEKTREILWRILLIRKDLGSYDFVMTSEYFSCFALNLRLLLSRCRTRHITVAFNQSRRLLKTGISIIDKIIDRIFRRNDLFFVHSQHEIALFTKLHNIPPEKFCFLLWGFDLPAIEIDSFAERERGYVCMIGRNNRDIEAFCLAAGGLDLDAVLITSQLQAIPSDLPANVKIYTDLSMGECLSCIKHARANLILVKNDERGAGHITAVASMMLGVPQIVSDARVLNDYFFDRYNCIKVAMGDATAIRSAIDKLLANPELAETLGQNGRDYAERWLTHRAVENRTFGVIGDLLAGRPTSRTDPSWDEEAFKFARVAK